VLSRVLQPLVHLWTELSRVELVDRSLALGAQALLALIPLLMVLNKAPHRIGESSLDQAQAVMGVPQEQLDQLAVGVASSAPDTTTLSILVAVLSATSFSRALQRMYSRVWGVPSYHGLRAVRSSVLWLVVWIFMLQATAGLIRWSAGIPLASLTIQLVGTTLIWWWTGHLLLSGRVPWSQLLLGGVVTGVMLVTLSELSHVFMPPYTRANLEQFGPLGIVFAVASWLVVFGGVLITATVLGRLAGGLLGRVRPALTGRSGKAADA
jgi:membrane protein